MIRWMSVVLVLLSCMLLVNCRHTFSSESGLFTETLERSPNVAVDGIWMWGGGNPYASERYGYIYIAPMKVDIVKEKKNERFLPYLQKQMAEDMNLNICKAPGEANKHNHAHWKLM